MTVNRKNVLVIDDQYSIRTSIKFVLDKDYTVHQAENVKTGLSIIEEQLIDVVILDLSLEGISGIDGLKMIKDLDRCLSVIILTGYGSLKTAQQAIRYKASDYLIKPFNTEKLRESVERCSNETVEMRTMQKLNECHKRLFNVQNLKKIEGLKTVQYG